MLTKKLKTLIICLLLTFTSLSQNVTKNNDSILCFPIQIVRNIEKDLIKGDYCDSISKSKDVIIDAQKEKISAKDSTLKAKNGQIDLFKQNETLWNSVVEVKDNAIQAQTKALKKEKLWKNIHKIGNFVLPVVASYFTYKVLTK